MAAIQDGQFAALPNGVRLHYASAGRRGAPLMLFVHGFPEAWFEWEAQLTAFGEDHYAVAPDLRGFNLSSKPAAVEAYKAKLIVQDLLLLMDHLGYERAIVVAHDWGGAVCWNLAVFQPARVRTLVIVNSPHPYTFARELAGNPAQRAASAYMNWLRASGSEAALVKDDFKLLDGLFTGGGQGPAGWYAPSLRARYHAMWSVPGEGGSHAMTGGVNYYRVSPLHPPEDAAPAALSLKAEDWIVRVPTGIIWGERDIALLPALLDGLDALVPDLRIVRIPDGSHWVVHEQPERVNALIRSFL